MEDKRQDKRPEKPKSARKPRQPAPDRAARNAKPSGPAPVSRATRAAIRDLTPDRLRHLWSLHHPDRPEVRAMLERLYRQS